MKWKKFEGPRFTLQVPEDWMTKSSSQFQVVFIDPSIKEGLPSNLAVTLRRVTEDVSIPDVAKEARASQETQYPEYKILKTKTGKRKTGQGFTRIYTWHHPKRDIPVVQQQTLYLVDRILYTLTATRPQEVPDAEAVDKIFTKIATSFQAGT